MRTYEGLRFCWTCNQFQTCQDCRTFAYGCISCSEHMEDYNVFVHSNKDSKDSGAPLAFASFCDDYPNREWTIFHM